MIGSYDIGNETVIPQISFCKAINTKNKKMFKNSSAAGENNEDTSKVMYKITRSCILKELNKR